MEGRREGGRQGGREGSVAGRRGQTFSTTIYTLKYPICVLNLARRPMHCMWRLALSSLWERLVLCRVTLVTISPDSGRDCVKSIRSFYAGFYAQNARRTDGRSVSRSHLCPGLFVLTNLVTRFFPASKLTDMSTHAFHVNSSRSCQLK